MFEYLVIAVLFGWAVWFLYKQFRADVCNHGCDSAGCSGCSLSPISRERSGEDCDS